MTYDKELDFLSVVYNEMTGHDLIRSHPHHAGDTYLFDDGTQATHLTAVACAHAHINNALHDAARYI